MVTKYHCFSWHTATTFYNCEKNRSWKFQILCMPWNKCSGQHHQTIIFKHQSKHIWGRFIYIPDSSNSNVWCIKNRTNHSSKALLSLVWFLMNQTLYRVHFEKFQFNLIGVGPIWLKVYFTVIKFLQINALGIWEHGWFLYVHDPKYVIVATMIDWTWFVLSFISPIVESAYFRFHHPYETVNINLKLSHGRKKKEELPEEL